MDRLGQKNSRWFMWIPALAGLASVPVIIACRQSHRSAVIGDISLDATVLAAATRGAAGYNNEMSKFSPNPF